MTHDTTPEIVQVGTLLDFELAELLGEKPGQFLCLHLNDQHVKGVGTPPDSIENRVEMATDVKILNESDEQWKQFVTSWCVELSAQFKVPAKDILSLKWRPKASFKIQRVVAGRSQYLHAAVQLLEKFESQISEYDILYWKRMAGPCTPYYQARIWDISRRRICASSTTSQAEALALCFRDFLTHLKQQA